MKNVGILQEVAPGIPSSRNVDPLPEIKKPANWTLSVQKHLADRAGEHLDLRLIDPSTGKAHSWALPKARMPEPGESVLAIQQPTHTADYALNFGKKKPQEITEGYGKGTISMHRQEPADVYHSTASLAAGTRVRFNLYPSTGPEEYVIVRTAKGSDLLVNKTITKSRLDHLILGSKPKLKEKSFAETNVNDTSQVLLPKYDGAHTLLDLPKAGKIPRLYSYRTPIRHTAGVIEHSHKVPVLLELRVPKELEGTVLRAETIAIGPGGKALPAKDVAGMLNATVTNSRARQAELKATLLPILFDVEKYKGKDVQNQSFSARHEILKEVHKQLGLPIAEIAVTAKEKQRLLARIDSGKHPLTTEGVIARPLNTPGVAIKHKLRPDHDVYVRSVFGATDKNGDALDRAGGFEFSWTPKGKIVGRVGTGFDHALLKDMLNAPDKYLGRVAKVTAEQKYESGALGKPAFVDWHMDKGLK